MLHHDLIRKLALFWGRLIETVFLQVGTKKDVTRTLSGVVCNSTLALRVASLQTFLT